MFDHRVPFPRPSTPYRTIQTVLRDGTSCTQAVWRWLAPGATPLDDHDDITALVDRMWVVMAEDWRPPPEIVPEKPRVATRKPKPVSIFSGLEAE